MRNRSTARLRPGSWPGRWLALALLAIPLPGPAAADQPAPPATDNYHLAIIDVPPTPEQAAAAALIVPAAQAAIHADGRFAVATAEQIAAARAEHGVGDTDLSYPDACRVSDIKEIK